MRIVRSLISWVLALFLMFIFVQATFHPLPDPPVGSVKFYDLPNENIVFQTLAEKSGYGLFEPTGRVLVGIIEVFAAFCLLIPPFRRFGAFLSIAILGGAVGLHLSPWLGQEVPLALGSAETDGGALFYLALGALAASILLFFIHPGQRPNR